LKIEFVTKPSDGNLMFVFDTHDRFDRFYNRSSQPTPSAAGRICTAPSVRHVGVHGAKEIDFAVIGIPIDQVMSLGKLQDCVIEETTRAGLRTIPTTCFPLFSTITARRRP